MSSLACVQCGEPVDPTVRTGFYREVTGWERRRPDGGANAIAFRAETGRLLHTGCAEQWKVRDRLHVSRDQEALI